MQSTFRSGSGGGSDGGFAILRAGRLALGLTLASLALGGCAAVGPAAPGEVEKAGGSLPDLLSLAQRSEDSGNLRMAANVYEEAARRFPEVPGPYLGLARSAYAAGQADQAARHYRAALERATPEQAKESFEARYGLGKALLADDRLSAAVKQFDALIEAGTEDHRPYLAKGVAMDLSGDHGTAQESYRAGLRNAPANIPLRNNLALSLALSGQHESAMAMLEDLTRDPTAPARARQNLALVYGLAGEMDEAAAAAQQDLGSSAVNGNLAYYRALQDVQNGAQGSANGEAGNGKADVHPAQPSGGLLANSPKPDRGGSVQLASRVEAPFPQTTSAKTRDHSQRTSPAGKKATVSAEESRDAEENTDFVQKPLDSTTSERLYWVQFASFDDAGTSERVWNSLKTEHKDLLDGQALSMHTANIEGRGTFYRVRTGPFADARASRSLCEAMQTRGQDCLVIRR